MKARAVHVRFWKTASFTNGVQIMKIDDSIIYSCNNFISKKNLSDKSCMMAVLQVEMDGVFILLN